MSLQRITSYLKHRLRRVDEHAIHSPYFFDFYMRVLKKRKRKRAGDPAIEKLRDALYTLRSSATTHQQGIRLDVAELRRPPLSQSLLYRRIAGYIAAKNIVEVGAASGLNSLYLSRDDSVAVHAFEEQRAWAEIAKKRFSLFRDKKITLIYGPFDNTLPAFVAHIEKIDMALFNVARCADEAIRRYVFMLVKKIARHGIVAISDIHRDKGMTDTWHTLTSHPKVYGSIDLYCCGLLFFKPQITRQHFVCAF